LVGAREREHKPAGHATTLLSPPKLRKIRDPHPHLYIRACNASSCTRSGQGSLLNRNPAQELEVGENLGCAEHHAAQRVVGDAYRQSSFFPDSLVQVLE